MTAFAGCLNRDRDQPVPEALSREMAGALGRFASDDELALVRRPGFFMATLDIGAFEGTGRIEEPDGRVVALAGEALLGDHETGQRDLDAEALLRAWREGGLAGELRTAHGVFSAVLFDPRSHDLVLITDKLGVRPVYVAETADAVFFASALHVLEAVDAVPKRMDLRGVTELGDFGCPLGNRTPYSTISILRDGQYVRCREGDPLEWETYWRWDEVPTSDEDQPELLRKVHGRFETAIRRRTPEARPQNAFLSGGLDSRAVVCLLRSLDFDVRTWGFSFPGSKDAVYGKRFAERVATEHHQVHPGPGRPRWSQMMADQLRSHGEESAAYVAWSGDGGSVGLGHVYVKEAPIEAARAGNLDEAARMMLEGGGALPVRLLSPSWRRTLAPVSGQGLLEELKDVAPDDPGRAVYLFYLRNDQRRHLTEHFESIDESRLELQLPFLDSEFLASVLTVPLNGLLRHAFYVRWLDLLPCPATDVPWQVYPGHVGPAEEDGAEDHVDQWRDPRPPEWRDRRRREVLHKAERLLDLKPFPHTLIRRPVLRLAYWLTRLGIRDLGYLIDGADRFARHWQVSGGRIGGPRYLGSGRSRPE